ncbi:MAG: dTDP-4-dehydrorhamnose reductase [Thermodesulfobacteriota bacterium]|nr:dTDP-4-dehydrorhamnose reductase [Thermodesulfobacteriota bacterium]
MNPHKKIAIIGGNGMLASMFQHDVPAALDLHLFDLPEFDITNAEQICSILTALTPAVIINCAAFTQVDACETQQEIAFQVNGEGPGNLARVAQQLGAVLVHISTDFVFSGESATPYSEDDATEPCSIYGQSKLKGEQAIRNSGLTDYYIVRTSWLYGPNGGNFVETMIRLADERDELAIVADQSGTPTYTADLVTAIWSLIGASADCNSVAPYGIYHYSNAGVCTWYDFACEIINQLRNENTTLKVQQVKPITTDEYPVPAKRPVYSVMSKQKIVAATGMNIPPWQESLKMYFEVRC